MASFKFKDNGKVEITITHGKKYNGKPKRYYKTVTYVNDKKLETDAALFLADIVNGEISASGTTTINALFEDFILHNGGTNTELKQSTAIRYRTLYDNQIKEYLGDRKINNIKKVDVRDWVTDLVQNVKNKKTGKPLSTKTVKNALSLLSSLYKYAIDDLDLVENNPCQGVKVPNQKEYKVKERYSDVEVMDLISCLMQEKENNPVHVTLILLILFTGMRTGEVMGLRWPDIDFKRNTIKIERERIMAQGKIIVDTPKTQESIRTISIPDFLASELKDLRITQQRWAAMNNTSFRFDNYLSIKVDAEPLNPYATYEWFKKFQKRYDLKDCTVHDLRHTHAAMLSCINVNIMDVSKRLGHSNTRVTQEIYEYYFKDTDIHVSNKLNDYYEKVINIHAV